MVSALSAEDVLYTAAGIKVQNAASATLDIPSSMEFAQPINTVEKTDT